MIRGLNCRHVVGDTTHNLEVSESFSGDTRSRRARRATVHIEKLKAVPCPSRSTQDRTNRCARICICDKGVTAGPDAQDRAEELRKKFVIKVVTGGHPKSDANVDQVMVAYLFENKNLVRKRGLERHLLRPGRLVRRSAPAVNLRCGTPVVREARSVLDVGAWLSCHIQDDRRLNPASYRSACRTTPSGVRHRARRTRWSATGKWRWSSGVCSRC